MFCVSCCVFFFIPFTFFLFFFFFFNDTATTEIYTLSLHDALPIWVVGAWPSERSMSRVLRYDGWLPYWLSKRDDPDGLARPEMPNQLAEVRDWIAARRS